MAKVKVGRRLTAGVTQFTLRNWLQFGKVSEDVTRRTVPPQPTQPQCRGVSLSVRPETQGDAAAPIKRLSLESDRRFPSTTPRGIGGCAAQRPGWPE